MAAPRLYLERGTEPYPGVSLTQFLGRGGWGEVWKAQRADGQILALKFLPSDSQLASSQEIRALQSIRSIRHPNLLRTENVWSCPGYLVIVMELADGSLLDLLDVYRDELHGGICQEHACYFLAQAAAALDFLNTRQHLVNDQRVAFRHCDIKPSNLLLIGKTVKVADFSLAVQTTNLMWYHRRAGTPAYAAPEIHQGWLSDRSDQYSLAVSYYLLRTATFPFDETPGDFSAAQKRAAPNLSKLSAAERPIIARGLAHVPQDRWPSCADMMDRLAKCGAKA